MAARVYIGWCKHKSEFGSTVEPRYLELGYLELPTISNLNPFPLDLPLLFQSFILGYLELGYLELPAISNYFLFPFGPKSTPVISNSNDEVD